MGAVVSEACPLLARRQGVVSFCTPRRMVDAMPRARSEAGGAALGARQVAGPSEVAPLSFPPAGASRAESPTQHAFQALALGKTPLASLLATPSSLKRIRVPGRGACHLTKPFTRPAQGGLGFGWRSWRIRRCLGSHLGGILCRLPSSPYRLGRASLMVLTETVLGTRNTRTLRRERR